MKAPNDPKLIDEVIELWEVAQLSSNPSQIQVQDTCVMPFVLSVLLLQDSETCHSVCFLATLT